MASLGNTATVYLINTGQLTLPVIPAIATAVVGAVGGAAIGVGAGLGIECIAQELEKDSPDGKEAKFGYQVLAGSLRVGTVAAGTGLTITAILGVLGISAAAVACVASMGIGLAVVGAVGLVFAVYRYHKKKKYTSFADIAQNMVNGPLSDEELEARLQAVAKMSCCSFTSVKQSFAQWLVGSKLSQEEQIQALVGPHVSSTLTLGLHQLTTFQPDDKT